MGSLAFKSFIIFWKNRQHIKDFNVMNEYKNRIADKLLARKLEGKGAVLIEGPKWCGKTTTAEQMAKSVLYMDDPQYRTQNLAVVDINPAKLLQGGYSKAY